MDLLSREAEQSVFRDPVDLTQTNTFLSLAEMSLSD